jgi:hypothetical protein
LQLLYGEQNEFVQLRCNAACETLALARDEGEGISMNA